MRSAVRDDGDVIIDFDRGDEFFSIPHGATRGIFNHERAIFGPDVAARHLLDEPAIERCCRLRRGRCPRAGDKRDAGEQNRAQVHDFNASKRAGKVNLT